MATALRTRTTTAASSSSVPASEVDPSAVPSLDSGAGSGGRRRRRSLAWVVRWLHTYVSLLGFGTLIFFSATGITLNHAELFESSAPVDRAVSGALSREWLAPGDDDSAVDRLAVVETLRAEAGLRGRVIDFSIGDYELFVIFEGPAYTADVSVDRETGEYDALETRQGVIALLDDLHKGRSTGPVWSWVIDISAAVLLVAGLTGLWLLWFVRLRRVWGLALTGAGSVALVAVWFVWERV